MNVQVKHNGTAITGFIISYERVHKICTGIGTLHVEISDNISRTFAPWDSIDIYENGDFKVRYYVSSIEHAINRSTYVLDCQDNSKRIVDYFIPDSYTVDYPSYTRYWIEKFLTEAGVSYEFTTNSQGTLLSNFTNLGLVTVYEQILTLLQMSGWYMYFDGNGVAIIGSLSLDFAVDRASVGKTDVLDISVESNDKMLRNKALVFGAYDAFTGTNAKASVTVHTPWNYDQRDVRTVVISNSNIPNNSTAYGMANQIIKEFARITVEKHITVWGARNFNLGTALRVTTNVWKGRGLITTFGTSLSKTGLVTNIVLDERCPRLFGYFDFGDYVYVATYGDGTWRKHIKFDPTWYNFSTGYTNLQITDLHINNGVFGSVSSSGQMYYAIDDLPWHNIAFSSFMSSSITDVTNGSGDWIPFSGLMARATIIDKYGNTVKFGVDTNISMPNYGDYFLMYSGMVHASGIVSGSGITSSGNRGWIVEYDVLAGDLTGTVYPISVSGNFDITVIDLENDGQNDYVSVKLGGGSQAPLTQNAITNWGYHQTQPFASTDDDTSYTAYPDADSIAKINAGYLGNQQFIAMNVQDPNALYAIDNMISGYDFVVSVGIDRKARKTVFSRAFNVGQNRWVVSKTTTTSAATAALVGATVLGIYPDLGADTYRIFYRTGSYVSEGNITYKYIDWDALANTFGSATTIGTTSPQARPAGTDVVNVLEQKTVVRGNVIYNMNHYHRRDTGSGGFFVGPSHQYVDVVHIDMTGPSLTDDKILDFATPQYLTSGRYYFFPANGTNPSSAEGATATFECSIFEMFEDGNSVQIIGRTELYYNDTINTRSTREYLFFGNATVIQNSLLYSDDTSSGTNIRRFPTIALNHGSQLTTNNSFIGGHNSTAGGLSFAYNGTVFQTYLSAGGANPPHQYRFSDIYPMFADNNNQYIVFDGDVNLYKLYNASDFSLASTLDFSGQGLYPETFCSTAFGTFGTEVYATVFNDNDGLEYIAPFNFSSLDMSRAIQSNTGVGSFGVPNFGRRTINFGNIFITDADYTSLDPTAGVFYIDIGTPDWPAATFLLLKRDGTDYTIIEEEAYPMRADISNQAPVLTVGSGEPTFVSNYVYENSLTVIESTSLSGNQVNDYRYAMLEPMVSGVVQSGYSSLSTILYIYGSGIFSADALTYSGGFTPLFGVPSGYGTRIETSNFGMGGQYIFITTSGNVQNFYQSDPASISGIALFTLYSGLPQSRATIIRLDDAI